MMMEDPKEILRQLRKIELTTGILVEGLQSGIHHSIFRGRGMEFDGIREYVAGDDVRAIDWNVTARFNHPYIKEYTEERDQTFYFVVDVSGSGQFGYITSKQRKILEVTASLAFAALRNNDRIGLCLFSDRVEKFIPARRGRKHLVLILNTLAFARPLSRRTDLDTALRFLVDAVPRRSSFILLSDFITPPFMRSLGVLAHAHEVVAIRVTDPREQELPDIGCVELEDPETGEQVLADTSDPAFRERFAAGVRAHGDELSRMFTKQGMRHISLQTTDPYEIPLARFFRSGKQRRAARGRVF
jgi:uncharacterized protein (DUF58 family)